MDATRECLERLWNALHRLTSGQIGPALQAKLVLEAMHRIETEPADSSYRDLLQPLHDVEETIALRDAQLAKLKDAGVPAGSVLRLYNQLSAMLGKETKP